MPTTKEDIRGWLESAKADFATHVIVVCDTYDWEDYPVEVMPGDDVHQVCAEYDGKNMQKVMEVYRLDMDWEKQLGQHRSFNY